MKVSATDFDQAMTTHRVTPPAGPIEWKSIDFNANGNQILIHADPGLALVLDGYEGTIQRIFQSSSGTATSSCFTPDDQCVLMGTEAGTVEV